MMTIRASEQIDKLAPALLAAQIKIGNAKIDSDNPHFRSRYASLNAVLDACMGPLNEAGIFLIQAPVAMETKDCLGLVTRLTHAASGQWLEATMQMPLSKVDPQGMGSAITYARRYSLMAILGMAAEDDDAEAAMDREQSKPAQTRQEQRPAPRPVDEPGRDAGLRSAMSGNGLPSIPGVSYVEGSIHGQHCLIAEGSKVYPNRDQLKSAGFKFDMDSKSWYRPAPAPATEYDDVVPF